MAQLKENYIDINRTMKGVHRQICDSLNYCASKMPIYDNPEQMYYGLLSMVQYKSDPPNTELLQSVPTLFENNYWGRSGWGDCDCFTILVCSMIHVHKWPKQRIVLCGRNKMGPVHIFSEVYWKGKWYTMDLTSRLFNTHRKYKFYQHLYV